MMLPPIEADAATQMAIDAVLLDRCEVDTNAGFLRFYRMTPPGVTIGRNQKWRRVVDPEACRERGWSWVRRPTGGGALLHANEINYAIALGRGVLETLGLSSFRSVFEWIASGLAGAVGEFGMRPSVVVGSRVTVDRDRTGGIRQHGLCGKSLTQYEVAENGRKLFASAQLLTPDGVLQHGTVYLMAPGDADRFWPKVLHDKAMHVGGADDASPRWTDLSAAVEGEDWSQTARRLETGLQETLGLDLIDHSLSERDMLAVSAMRELWQFQGWHTRR